jgi:flagellar hook-length control protein FliK
MIKPSSAPAATPVAPRPAAPAGPESRAVGRHGETGAFAEAMEAQGPRDDTDAGRERTAATEDSGHSDDAAGAAVDASAPCGVATAPPIPADAPPVDPMLGLCTMTAGETAAGVDGLPPAPQADAVALEAATAAPATAAPGPARGALELLEGELQKRLALNGAALQAISAADVAVKETASVVGGPGEGGGAPMAGPTGHPGELRATDRAATAQLAQSAGRPPEVRAPLGSAAWADELGARVTWMAERGEQVASLRLSPENLGPIEVRIAVREGETSVWFGAAHADTRAALEQSLSRLRDMLGASGLSLADAGVSSQTPRDPQRGFTSAALARAARESGADPSGGIVMQVSRRGLVDLYA